MKSERISIFNYEAFYLDHLEGNLGEEDTALLCAFLAENPGLVVDELDFIILDANQDLMSFDEKESLKIVNDSDAIVLANVDYFLVAEAEGVLNPTKQSELNAFVVNHPHIVKERELLALLFLKSNEQIVFEDKAGLKRKGAVVLWPYIALVAASVLIALLFVFNDGSEETVVAEKDNGQSTPKKEIPNQKYPVELNEKPQIAIDDTPLPGVNKKVEKRERVVRDHVRENPSLAGVNAIQTQQVRRVINSVPSENLKPITSLINPPSYRIIAENDYAQGPSPEMKNPIKPITSQMERTLKTPIDFQTGKAANNTGAGFFIKIGKLEISRKKGKN